jgi:negative regulator of flagellin synthesis FlgM
MAIESVKNGGRVSQPTEVSKASPKSDVFNRLVNEAKENVEISATVKTTPTNVVTTADSVMITSTVAHIKKSIELTEDAGMDVKRLARIKQAIENGTYTINPDRIAAKMIQFESL